MAYSKQPESLICQNNLENYFYDTGTTYYWRNCWITVTASVKAAITLAESFSLWSYTVMTGPQMEANGNKTLVYWLDTKTEIRKLKTGA